MALIETFEEPWDDLSQWTEIIGDATVVSNHVEFFCQTGVSEQHWILTNASFDMHDSWMSAQVLLPGVRETTYPAGESSGLSVNVIRAPDYGLSYGLRVDYNEDTDETQIYVASNTVSFSGLITPYVAFAVSGGDLTSYASDDGVTWQVVEVVTDPFPANEVFILLSAFGDGDYLSDHTTAVGLFNEFSPLTPALSEVDKTVDSSWNVWSVVDDTFSTLWNLDQGYLRHSTRHLHKTLFDYLSDQLATMGWTVDGSVPFNAPVVTLHEVMPDEWEEASVLEPGTVAITLGDEDAALNQELGGPLATIEVPFFVDCFMDTPGTTLALALDIRDIFCGRTSGSLRIMNVTNYNPSSPTSAPGYTVEFEDVVREKIKKNWEVVKFTACMYFPDMEGN